MDISSHGVEMVVGLAKIKIVYGWLAIGVRGPWFSIDDWCILTIKVEMDWWALLLFSIFFSLPIPMVHIKYSYVNIVPNRIEQAKFNGLNRKMDHYL